MTQEPVQEGYSLIRLSSLVGLCVPYIVARSLRLACTLLFSGRCTAPSARLQIERAGILGSDSPSFPDSSECVEGKFSELPVYGVLGSSEPRGKRERGPKHLCSGPLGHYFLLKRGGGQHSLPAACRLVAGRVCLLTAAPGRCLKLLVGDLATFAERRGAGKHQVDGLCALLHHPYLNALRQPAPQLLHMSPLGFMQTMSKPEDLGQCVSLALHCKLPRTHQRVEKLLRALLCLRFGGRIRRFRSVLDLFSGSLGEPTGPTTTFSTGWHLLST